MPLDISICSLFSPKTPSLMLLQRRKFVIESRGSKKKYTFITERSKIAKYLCNLCSSQHKFNNEMNSRQLSHSLVSGQLLHHYQLPKPFFWDVLLHKDCCSFLSDKTCSRVWWPFAKKRELSFASSGEHRAVCSGVSRSEQSAQVLLVFWDATGWQRSDHASGRVLEQAVWRCCSQDWGPHQTAAPEPQWAQVHYSLVLTYPHIPHISHERWKST